MCFTFIHSLQGASDDILNAKNTLYQHLTWDPEKSISLCSKLALPLATPAVGVTPPVSPKSTSAEGKAVCTLNIMLQNFGTKPHQGQHPAVVCGLWLQMLYPLLGVRPCCLVCVCYASTLLLMPAAYDENTPSSHYTITDRVLPTLGS